MNDFTFHIPTRILFGRSQLGRLSSEIKKHGGKVLLVYGGGSIKKIGLYDMIVKELTANQLNFAELSGVQPNPRIDSVRAGIKICREQKLDFILAAGGGSVIDCAKTIAAGYYYDGDPWDFFTYKTPVKQALPLGTILTIPASGSEMNGNAVISNPETTDKIGVYGASLIPRFSILDPACSNSLPPEQTAAGVADIMSHTFEQYFSPTSGTYLQDRLAEAILNTCIHYAPLAIKQPDSYEARSNIMWAGSIALNSLLGTGKVQDWATHGMEHELSALYDITHGLGLALLTPAWMEYVYNKNTDNTTGRLLTYARNVWQIEDKSVDSAVKQGIQKTKEFFNSLGFPPRLREVGVLEKDLGFMAKKSVVHGTIGQFMPLSEADVLAIYRLAF